MKKLLLATALIFPMQAFAGGPIVASEEAFVEEARPSSEGKWIIPLVVGLVVICAIACGNDDGPAPIKPVDPCNGCN